MPNIGYSDIQVYYLTPTLQVEITQLVSGISWSGDLAQAMRQCDVSVINTLNGRTKAINFENGEEIRVFNYGKEIFRGLIFSINISVDGSSSLSVYDANYYLTKNTDSKKFVSQKASQIITSLCKEYGIPFGYIEDTGYTIPKLLLKDKTLWDMMVISLTETDKQNGRKFKISNINGKLELRERSKELSPYILEDGVNITNGSYSKSIESLITKVKIIQEGENGEVIATVIEKDDTLIEKYGLMQHSESAGKEETRSEIIKKAKQYMKENSKPTEEMNIDALGIDNVISGRTIYVDQAMTNMLSAFYVVSDNHSFDNGVHTMSLTLSYTDELPRIEYEEDSTTVSASSIETPTVVSLSGSSSNSIAQVQLQTTSTTTASTESKEVSKGNATILKDGIQVVKDSLNLSTETETTDDFWSNYKTNIRNLFK